MNYQEVESFIFENEKFFNQENIPEIKRVLSLCDEATFEEVKKIRLLNPSVIQLVSVFLGVFGIDRFIVGDLLMGIIKLLTCGIFYIGWIVDIFKIKKSARFRNGIKVLDVASHGNAYYSFSHKDSNGNTVEEWHKY